VLSEKCEVSDERAPYARVFTVHPDLERLIRLQSLDLQAAEARRQQATIPETQRALDQKLESGNTSIRDNVPIGLRDISGILCLVRRIGHFDPKLRSKYGILPA